MSREDIDQEFQQEHADLEAAYYKTVPDGLGSRRILREGKDEGEFQVAHGDLWQRHEAALEDAGFPSPIATPAPVRDLASEVDVLKGKVAALETR